MESLQASMSGVHPQQPVFRNPRRRVKILQGDRMRLAPSLPVLAVLVLLAALFAPLQATATRGGHARTHRLKWNIVNTYIERNCYEGHFVATVDGQVPGPTIEITEGDTVIIHVTNKQSHPVTLHWHGIQQRGSNWADGPEYVTQCPIKEGHSYTYEFTVEGQRGSFWWHAHVGWMRATLYGHFIVHPKHSPPNYDAHRIHKQIPIALGAWYALDPNVVAEHFKYLGVSQVNAPFEIFAFTINGRPGPQDGNNSCSSNSLEPRTEVIKVKRGKTYLLRLVSAAINHDLHFKIADHDLTVVAADANYVKPFVTDIMNIAPGQTYDVLFTANKSGGKYYMAIGAALASKPPGFLIPVRPDGLAIIEYEGESHGAKREPIQRALLPDHYSRNESDSFKAKVKNYGGYALPSKVDVHLFYPVCVCVVKCLPFQPCFPGVHLGGSMQNISFVPPNTTSLLQAYYYHHKGVYTTDLPDVPPVMENWIDTTAPNPHYYNGTLGTKLRALKFGETVQVVLQNVNAFGNLEEHPYHLHGHDFYVVGAGFGNYDAETDGKKLNLVDPPLYNTFNIPRGGWMVIRFQANNPGVWLFHCHYERHAAWNMKMAFVVKDGARKNQILHGPTHTLPMC